MGIFCGLEIVQLPPILSLCTSCGLALNQHQPCYKKCLKNDVFVGSHVVSFVKSWSLRASPGAGRTGTWGTWQLYFSWLVGVKTEEQHFVKHRFKWLILVHFFDICCICDFLYLLWASGAMSGMLTNLTSEASSKPAHWKSWNSKVLFRHWKKKVKFLDIWWLFELFVIWTCTEYSQNTFVFLIMLQ